MYRVDAEHEFGFDRFINMRIAVCVSSVLFVKGDTVIVYLHKNTP